MTRRQLPIYNHLVKKPTLTLLAVLACGLIACNKSKAPETPGAAPNKAADAFGQKLRDYAGVAANDCGRLDVHATELQLKTASDCAQLAAQKKQAFFVGYDMPGMSVGVAGNADGKLFTVQSQAAGDTPILTSSDCPSQLRVASSGRITCYAPGDMGGMGGHAAGAVPPGVPNPHDATPSPHGTKP